MRGEVSNESGAHLLVKVFHFLKGSAKCRKNHHIAILNNLEVLLATTDLIQQVHVHLGQAVVHLRVVNQLIRDVDLLIGEVLDGFIRKSNTALDPPAETKVLFEEGNPKNMVRLKLPRMCCSVTRFLPLVGSVRLQ